MTLTIDGTPVDKFGSVTVSRAVSGIGTSGIVTSQLTFKVPAPLYADAAAEIVLGGINVPKYYIARREKTDGVITLTCYDKMAFADKCSFTPPEITGDTVQLSSVMPLICRAMGLPETAYAGTSGTIPAVWLKDSSCGAFLSKVSNLRCGVFYISDDNCISFLPCGSYNGELSVQKHTAVNTGLPYSVRGVKCINGKGRVFSRGFTENDYFAITISNDAVTDGICSDIWSRVSGVNFDACRVQRCVVSEIPQLVTLCSFAGGGEYMINSSTCNVTSAGIFATLSANGNDADEICMKGSLSRAVDNCVQMHKKCGNIINTPYQGIIVVDDDYDDEEEENGTV